MGAESGQNNADLNELEKMLMVSTEKLEDAAGHITEAAAAVRKAYQPIPEARTSLTAYNSGGITKQLQDLYDVECRYFKHIGQLEIAADTLRNIAITYDNAEQVLIDGKERPLSPVADPASIDPYNPVPGEKPKDPPKEEKKKSSGWQKEKREGEDENGDTAWYNEPFNTKGLIHIGQVKRKNYPESGGYKDQTVQTRGFGVNFFNYTGYSDDPTKTKNPETGLKEGPLYKEYPRRGDAPFAPQKVGTIAEIYADYSASWTGLGAQKVKNTDNLKYTVEAYLGRAEFNAHAGVGAFLYKTPDGQVVPAYGLSAQVGGSFTAAGAGVNADVGPSFLGAMGGASAVVGQVYANANATVGMVGGKFVAVASGAVGADAFKVTGTVGARIMGIEAKASASVKVGLSAKFEVGFDGGEFKANIGACLGLGFEINISIDFSKVGSALKAVGKGIVEAGRAIVRAGEAVVRWFRRW